MPGEEAFLRDYIAVTDSAGLHVNPYMSRARLRYFALHDFKVRSCLRHSHGFHFRHLSPLLNLVPSKWNRGMLISTERDIANVDGDQHRLRNFLIVGVRCIDSAFHRHNDSIDVAIFNGVV
jgi:hypothetical protein